MEADLGRADREAQENVVRIRLYRNGSIPEKHRPLWLPRLDRTYRADVTDNGQHRPWANKKWEDLLSDLGSDYRGRRLDVTIDSSFIPPSLETKGTLRHKIETYLRKGETVTYKSPIMN